MAIKKLARISSPGLNLKDAEQLALAEIENPFRKITPLPLPSDSPTQHERVLLEKKYAHAFEHRLDWRRLVTYVPNKDLPVYNWFKYKEGFSRELVARLFREFGLENRDVVFDPFAGCGTTLLCAQEYGLYGVGIDILATSVFVARAKLNRWRDLDALMQATQQLLAMPWKQPKTSFPSDVRIINLAFSPQTQRDLLFFKEQINTFDKPVRDFLFLGLLTILERVSSTSKDGQFLRLVQKQIPPVREALRSVLLQMISDLSERATFGPHLKGRATIKQGDAREMSLPKRYLNSVAAIITSPPYLNRYDYSRTYALELCLLTARCHQDMVRIRHSLLRSHVESREHDDKHVDLPCLAEVLREVRSKPLNNERLPVMIQGYFEDMNLVIRSMAAYLRAGGRVALVVANAQFAGENVPTDLMLCELAAQHGLATESIWVTRYKGNSSQQMAIYGRRPVRETIVFWRKNA